MKREVNLKHQFVEFVPNELSPGTIYISARFRTAVHLCCCGCGNKVVTPIGPTDWQLIFDGKSVSLYPSIGNWSFACRSHYWIRNGTVRWAAQSSSKKSEAARLHDRLAKGQYFGTAMDAHPMAPNPSKPAYVKAGFWKAVMQWLFGA